KNEASDNNIEGSVLLKVTFLETGIVGAIVPVKSVDKGLTDRAIAAARKIQFIPAMKNGLPHSVVKEIRYVFKNDGTWTEEMLSTDGSEATKVEHIKSRRAEKLHFWIFRLVTKLATNDTSPGDNDRSYISGDRAEVRIFLKAGTQDVSEKLRKAGFEFSEQDGKNILVGAVRTDKLDALTEIEEVEYILPSID
ncbi:MAG: TonB family protein, partial [Acidobacteria bacterium]|nr:TonB family protein [Acidobacteriota bacterium]